LVYHLEIHLPPPTTQIDPPRSYFNALHFDELLNLHFRRIATETYDVDVLAVNMLALVFALFYIPGSIFAIALYAQYGLNSCIMWAAFFNMFACLFRYSSCLMPSRHTAYSAILVGHMFAAFGSPLVVNAPSRVANDWFPPRERAVAISIMTQANYLGGGLGGLIPTLQVVGSSGIVPMLLSQAILAGVIMLLSIVFTPSHSPVHADFDAAYQVELRSDVDVTNAMSIYNQMLR
jgi:Major Facilitator Superfamily